MKNFFFLIKKERNNSNMSEDNSSQYDFDSDKYNHLIGLLTSNEAMMMEHQKMKNRHPGVIDLLTLDWEEMLKNSEPVKRWRQQSFTGIESSYGAKNNVCKIFKLPPNHSMTVLIAGNFLFFRKSKQASVEQQTQKSNNCEVFNCGPVYFLADILSAHLKKNRFGYLKLFIENCNAHCNQCKKYKMKSAENMFCTKYLSFFDGTDKNLITSEYIRYGKKSFIGMAIVEITSYITFGKDFKLSGSVVELIVTNEACIRPSTDDGVIKNLLKMPTNAKADQELEDDDYGDDENESSALILTHHVPSTSLADKQLPSTSSADQQPPQLKESMIYNQFSSNFIPPSSQQQQQFLSYQHQPSQYLTLPTPSMENVTTTINTRKRKFLVNNNDM